MCRGLLFALLSMWTVGCLGDAPPATLPDVDTTAPDTTDTSGVDTVDDTADPPDTAPPPVDTQAPDTAPPPECTPATDWKCADADVCTDDRCEGGVCVNKLIEGCCNTDDECDDGIACTIDRCNLTKSECLNSLGSNLCCLSAADCGDAGPCDDTFCAGNRCTYPFRTTAGGCGCSGDFACDDQNPCTEDSCSDDACHYTAVGASIVDDVRCCLSAADCDDNDASTAESCLGGVCKSSPIACTTGADCAGANVCDTGPCVDGSCKPNPDCCLSDFECDDGVALTSDRCIANRCVHLLGAPVPCANSSDCSPLTPCTTGVCKAAPGLCSWAPVAGPGCCITASDCTADDACSTPTCDLFSCGTVPNADPQLWAADFDDTLNGWTVSTDGKAAFWQLTTAQAVSAPSSLYYGRLPQLDYDVGHTQGTITSPQIALPPGTTDVRVLFWRSADVEPFASSDDLRLELLQGGQSTIVWDKGVSGPGQGWKQETIPLTLTSTAPVRLRWFFDSIDEVNNVGQGVFVDDMRIVTPCE